MKNGPELWDKILAEFPGDHNYVVGGAVRDYVLGVAPKDIDVFCPYSPWFKPAPWLHALDFDRDHDLHKEEYAQMRIVHNVMKGKFEGFDVDYVGVGGPDNATAIILDFDTAINQIYYVPSEGFLPGYLVHTRGFMEDYLNNTVTIMRQDGEADEKRTQKRFERFNTRMNGAYTLQLVDEKDRQKLKEIKHSPL